MVYKPDLLIADEPTSGLDTTTAVQCVKYMKAAAAEFGNGGCILSIHQPNVRQLRHHLGPVSHVPLPLYHPACAVCISPYLVTCVCVH